MSSNLDQNSDNIEQIITREPKILTYNTFLRPPLVNNNGNDYKNERCDLIINELMNFDIVCLQEVFGFLNSRKQKLKHKAFKMGFTYQAVSPSPSFFSSQMVDGGLITLSRFPILYHQFQEFPYGILSDNLSNKGILYTKIQIENQILHLFNTHLQASYVGNESNVIATVQTRIDQMNCFRKFLIKMLTTQQAKKEDLILMIGDYNIDVKFENGFTNKILEEFPELNEQLNHPQRYIEYDALLKIMSNNGIDKFINLIYEQNKSYPITYADYEIIDNQKRPLEIQLTDKVDLLTGQCLDYIFQFQLGEWNEESKLNVQHVEVEKFFVEGHPFTQLSDHYGLSFLITGANRGLGYKLAEVLSPKYQILLTARNYQAALQSKQKILSQIPQANIIPLQLDTTDSQSIMNLKKEIKDLKLDVIVNNAGINDENNVQPLAELIMKTNLFGVMNLTESLQQQLSQDGKILIITSILGKIKLQPPSTQTLLRSKLTKETIENLANDLIKCYNAGNYGIWSSHIQPLYKASKALVNAYARNVLAQNMGNNQSLYCLHPGWVKTDMGGPKAPQELIEGIYTSSYLIDKVPFQRNIEMHGKYFNEKAIIEEF